MIDSVVQFLLMLVVLLMLLILLKYSHYLLFLPFSID